MKKAVLCAIGSFFSLLLIQAQPLNREAAHGENNPYLIGKINREGLSNAGYAQWFLGNKRDYVPKPEVLKVVKEQLNDYTITLFMGTWCGDSKREVPRFYKILESVQFPLERLTAVAVGREANNYKQSPGGEQEGLNVHRVPTFIFYRNGKEINRIVERPIHTLEEDISDILKGEYRPNYQAVASIHTALEEMGLKKFQKKSKQLLARTKALVDGPYELSSYSYLLFTQGKKEEALAVAELNVQLYPEDARVYHSLGNRLLALERNTEALVQFKSALLLDPGNEKAKKAIRALETKEVQ